MLIPARDQIFVYPHAVGAKDLPDVGGLNPLGFAVVGALHIPMLSGDLLSDGLASIGGGRSHPCPGPLGQLVALELGEYRHHGQHRRAHGAGGYPLSEPREMDPIGIASQTAQLPHPAGFRGSICNRVFGPTV